jgi:hypothetical protein
MSEDRAIIEKIRAFNELVNVKNKDVNKLAIVSAGTALLEAIQDNNTTIPDGAFDVLANDARKMALGGLVGVIFQTMDELK